MRPEMRFRWLLLLAGAACTTGSSNTMAGAATMTAAAVGAAAAQRASGGCIAICTHGTACNPKTGLCQKLRACEKCAANEHCEQTFTDAVCVPGEATGVATTVAPKKPPAGVAPVITAPDPNHPAEPPTPAAEKATK